MNYNNAMRTLALALLCASSFARAEPTAAGADAETTKLVEYFLKTPTSQADTKLVASFLAVDPAQLPERLRAKTRGKQLEIRTLIHLHDTKKKGNWLRPAEGCTLEKFIFPLKDAPVYLMAGYEYITEEQESYVKNRTSCEEQEQGCQFSLIILFDKGKPRRLLLYPSDPLNAVIAEMKNGKGGQTNFFGRGAGITCAK
jgi:hypothetical protein